VLLFGDESEALTHPYLAHVWAKKGADLRIPAPGQAAKGAMLGVLDWARRELIVHTSRTKRSSDFIALLEEIDRRYGPKLGVTIQPVVLVLDNGPIHTSKATHQALAHRQHWLTVEWLPKYAPELNDIERSWRDLKRHYLAHRICSEAISGAGELLLAFEGVKPLDSATFVKRPMALRTPQPHGTGVEIAAFAPSAWLEFNHCEPPSLVQVPKTRATLLPTPKGSKT